MNLTAFTRLMEKLPIKDRLTHKMHYFSLFPNQKEALRLMGKQMEDVGRIRAVFLKSRRVGISSLCDAMLFADCLSTPNRENLIVAHVKDTSEGLFRVPRDMAKSLNEIANVSTIQTKRIMVKHNEGPSVLDIATAGTVSSGRGLSLSNIHMSEAAQYPGQDSFLSLLPAVAEGDNTAIFIESTAFGTTGVGESFYEFWQSAVERRNGFIPIFLGWLTDPGCVSDPELANDAPATDLERELMKKPFNASKAQIAWMRMTLESKCQGHEKKWLQEYPHTESVAFSSTNDPAFTPEEVNFAKTTLREPIAEGHMEWSQDKPNFVKVRGGALVVWELPILGHKYYIGMDAAVGIDTGDFAAASVWDGTTGNQVAQYADKVVPEVLAHVMHCLGHWYNRAMTNGELTGNSGREVLRVLRDHYHYPFFAQWKGKDDKLLGRGENRKPTVWWETTSYSRMKMFDTFRVSIRGGMKPHDSFDRCVVRDKALWGQMANATLSETGRWELRLGHDDILVSAMLAVVAIAQNPVPRMSGQSALLDSGENERDRVGRILPGIVDDATLSLGRHYRKVMALSKKHDIKEARSWQRMMGQDRLAGV